MLLKFIMCWNTTISALLILNVKLSCSFEFLSLSCETISHLYSCYTNYNFLKQDGKHSVGTLHTLHYKSFLLIWITIINIFYYSDLEKNCYFKPIILWKTCLFYTLLFSCAVNKTNDRYF